MSQGQKQVQHRAKDAETAPVEETAEVQAKGEKLKADIDSILDEIDDVLEEQATDFVKDFVQRGGE